VGARQASWNDVRIWNGGIWRDDEDITIRTTRTQAQAATMMDVRSTLCFCADADATTERVVKFVGMPIPP
jgi:hypothetical protein